MNLFLWCSETSKKTRDQDAKWQLEDCLSSFFFSKNFKQKRGVQSFNAQYLQIIRNFGTLVQKLSGANLRQFCLLFSHIVFLFEMSFMMVGDKVAGAIMTEFLRNLELNQQDMGSAEKNTKKYKSVKVQKSNCTKES